MPRRGGRGGRRRGGARKTQMLCRQVQRALDLGLQMHDDQRLAFARVQAVTPAPDADRLHVDFAVPPDTPDGEMPTIHAALAAAMPFLRGEMASAINRRRLPDLTFDIGRDEPVDVRQPAEDDDEPAGFAGEDFEGEDSGPEDDEA